MSPSGEGSEETGLRVGAQLLLDIRAEITRADTKATVLVGVLGTTAGALGALLTGRGWSPALLSAPAALLWWTSAVSHLVALLSALLAVVPRYGRTRWAPGRPLTYFGDVRRAARVGQLTAALTEAEHDPRPGLLLALTETSAIAARKHFWVRTGLIAFGSFAVLLPCSLVIA